MTKSSSEALVLGIETSCDDTSVGLVRDGHCLSLVTQSSVDEHAEWGGIVPELASRRHILSIVPVVKQALDDAGCTLGAVDAVAATYGPGLAGSLLVGYNFAQGLAAGLGIPLLAVNHLSAHAHACWLDRQPGQTPVLPAICLLVSGGHTELTLMEDLSVFRPLGRTRDDAVGEAFDKAARIMGLGFPGGPAIERAAAECHARGFSPFNLPRARLAGSWDFSLSGIKSAIGRAGAGQLGPAERRQIFGDGDPAEFAARRASAITRMAAGFQAAVIEVLAEKTSAAARRFAVGSVLLCGGVAANRALRGELAARSPVPLFVPDFGYCVDNGAMVAISAQLGGGRRELTDINPGLRLPELQPTG